MPKTDNLKFEFTRIYHELFAMYAHIYEINILDNYHKPT